MEDSKEGPTLGLHVDGSYWIKLGLCSLSIALMAWRVFREPAPAAAPATTPDVGDRGPGLGPAEQLQAEGLDSEDADVRLDAVRELALTAGPEPLGRLIPLMRDPSPAVRREVIIRLGAGRAEAYLPLLLEATRDVDVSVQHAAHEALVGYDGPQVLDLFRRLALSSLPVARVVGVRGLAAAGGHERLILEIFESARGQVRREAAVALAGSSLPEAARAVRSYLGEVSAQGSPEIDENTVPLERFVEILDSEPTGALLEELEARFTGLPSSLRKAQVLTTLLGIVRDVTEGERRRYLAVRCLGFLGGQTVMRELKELAVNSLTAVRFGAVIALGRLRSLRTATTLREAQRDPSSIVRAAAVHFLSGLVSPGDAGLLALADDPSPLVRGMVERDVPIRRTEEPRMERVRLEAAVSSPEGDSKLVRLMREASRHRGIGAPALGAEKETLAATVAQPRPVAPDERAARRIVGARMTAAAHDEGTAEDRPKKPTLSEILARPC